jgi:hypothetical protein
MTFLNGLWAGGTSANSDFATVAYQLQLLGFNAIRLPFLFEDLRTPAANISGYCTRQSTLVELAQRTVDPADPNPPSAAELQGAPKPKVPLFDTSVPGSCNHYIPWGGSTMERFLWHIQWLVASGWYVLIDYHPMVSRGRGVGAGGRAEGGAPGGGGWEDQSWRCNKGCG